MTTMSTTPTHGLSIGDLENVYDALAQAIDTAGDRAELMLVKLALLQAEAGGTAQAFEQHLQTALQDL